MRKTFKNEIGITLITLVITIIVLIILATISIGILGGENGIIQKSKYAKEETRGANVEEERDIWKLNEGSEEYSPFQSESLQELINRLVKEKLLTEDEKDQILGNAEKGIEATGQVTIGSRTIVFEIEGEKTLVKMFEKAKADNCMNLDGQCKNLDHLHIGDYVNYKNPTSGTYTITAEKSGMNIKTLSNPALQNMSQTYDVSKNQLNWRVLGIDKETGGIKLIAGSPMKRNEVEGIKDPYLYLKGAEAYVYGPEEMDKVCELYKNEYAVKTRSVKIEDINEVIGIQTEDQIKEYNFWAKNGLPQYKDPYSYINQYTPESWLNGKQETTVSGEVTGYAYVILYPIQNARAKSMLFDNVEVETGKAYWLASHGVMSYPDRGYASFGPEVVGYYGGGTVVGFDFSTFDSDGSENNNAYSVRPVVSLKSNITENEIKKISDKIEETWNY